MARDDYMLPEMAWAQNLGTALQTYTNVTTDLGAEIANSITAKEIEEVAKKVNDTVTEAKLQEKHIVVVERFNGDSNDDTEDEDDNNGNHHHE
ncbi:hypothetical protein FQA39_LY06876 [Lamprigera yunnana]|nr:hypothetical protein FQA39_LY06876 [Lamprigera yunnana]